MIPWELQHRKTYRYILEYRLFRNPALLKFPVKIEDNDNCKNMKKSSRYMIMAVLVCVTIILGGYYVEADIDETREKTHELMELIHPIEFYDEALTMSARMAALTGDLSWEDRYRKYEKETDRDLKRPLK